MYMIGALVRRWTAEELKKRKKRGPKKFCEDCRQKPPTHGLRSEMAAGTPRWCAACANKVVRHHPPPPRQNPVAFFAAAQTFFPACFECGGDDEPDGQAL